MNGRPTARASRSSPSIRCRPTASGGAPRTFGLDEAWVNEYVWAPDSQSIYIQANDGTFGRGVHMFEQPIVRVSVADGRAERLGTGPTVAFSLGLSHDGRRIAYK